jgi:glycosyltransferase involved in cell wall biosynthesis
LDLERCLVSLAKSELLSGDEVVIVDDSELPEALVSSLRACVTGAGFAFTYHQKQNSDGLYASRSVAVSLARGEVIVFLDDDVEVPVDFLTRLRAHYVRDASLMGVGGVEVNPRGRFVGYAFSRLFLIASRNPGHLSVTGMGGSYYKWLNEGAPFETEFMYGFCMSFRRRAVADLQALPWLVGYSPGEDLLVSKQAGLHGRLVIDPALQVTHHNSPTNRWDNVRLRSEVILLAIPIQRILKPTRTAGLLIYWSILGRVLHPLLAFRWPEFVPTLKALGKRTPELPAAPRPTHDSKVPMVKTSSGPELSK